MLHQRMRQVLAELLISDPEGGAVDYGRDVISQGKGGHGKHGTRTTPPPQVESLAVEYAQAFARLVELAELDLAIKRGRVKLAPRRIGSAGRVSSQVAKDRKRRITSLDLYRGRPAEWVAFAEGCTAETVRKARGERGLDPATGLKPSEAPVEKDEQVRPKGRVGRLTSRDLPESDDTN